MPSTAPREGKLILTPAIPADAPRIAELHMAGFGNDPILLAAFPTPAVRDALQRDLEARTVREIGSSRMSVLVVRCVEYEGEEKHDEGRGVDGVEEGKRKSTVVSLAKWAHPMAEAEEGQHVEEQPRARPEGTVVRILERYHEELEKVQSKVIGKTPCYRMFSLLTRLLSLSPSIFPVFFIFPHPSAHTELTIHQASIS